MHLDGGAVVRCAGNRDLELARQEDEFRVQRRPLPQDLGIGARIDDLVGAGAGEVIGGDVADAVAGGLDGVHLDLGQTIENVGDVLQRRPVELEVLARGEMAVAAVVPARDRGERPELRRIERAIGNGDPQHVGVELQIDAVHQAQRLELLLGQLADQASRHLPAELVDAGVDEIAVKLVVPVHSWLPCRASRAPRLLFGFLLAPAALHASWSRSRSRLRRSAPLD